LRLIVDEEGKMRDHITTFNDGSLTKVYNQTVKKVTEDMETIKRHTRSKNLREPSRPFSLQGI
jgi:leucyl-tRNA synthetase